MENIMYPNIMSRESLIQILKERCLKIPNLDELSTAEIVKIYSKFALPLSRRDECKKSYETNSSINEYPNVVYKPIACSRNHITLKRNSSALETTEVSKNKIIKLNGCNGDIAKYLELQEKRNVKNDSDLKIVDQDFDQCQPKFKRLKITWP